MVVDGLGKAGMEMEEDLGWGAVEDVTASVLGVLGEPVVGSVGAVEVALGLMATRLEWAVALMGRGGSLSGADNHCSAPAQGNFKFKLSWQFSHQIY